MSSCTRRNPTAVQLLCPANCKPTPPRKGAGLERLIPASAVALWLSANVWIMWLESFREPGTGWDQDSIHSCWVPATSIFFSHSVLVTQPTSQFFQGKVLLLLCAQCSGMSSSLRHTKHKICTCPWEGERSNFFHLQKSFLGSFSTLLDCSTLIHGFLMSHSASFLSLTENAPCSSKQCYIFLEDKNNVIWGLGFGVFLWVFLVCWLAGFLVVLWCFFLTNSHVGGGQ